MSRGEAKELDRVLSGSAAPKNEELADMAAIGEKIRTAYASFTPPHGPQRAMFVTAVSDRRGLSWTRFLAPVTVTAVLLIGLLFLGRTALPGGAFYPVRQVLRNVGLAPASVEEVKSLIAWADRLLDRAEGVADRDPEASERLAFEAARVIGMAEGALGELDVDERAQVTDELADVLARAKAILTEEPDEDRNRRTEGEAVLREGDQDDGKDDDDGRDDDDGSDPDGDSNEGSQDRANDASGNDGGGGRDIGDGPAGDDTGGNEPTNGGDGEGNDGGDGDEDDANDGGGDPDGVGDGKDEGKEEEEEDDADDDGWVGDGADDDDTADDADEPKAPNLERAGPTA